MRKGIFSRLNRAKSRKQQLVLQGEKWDRKEMMVCSSSVLSLALLLGAGMGLQPGWMIAAGSLCMIQAPKLYFHYKKAGLEKKRFHEANAYMAQMVQSFSGNGKILAALKETRETFWGGMMHQTLTRAICHIERSCDMELAEGEALGFVEKEYDCERVRMMHDFLQKAESRGGSCESEFGLLENIRRLWEKNTLRYMNTARIARNLVAFEYLLLMAVCMFMLRQFPKELTILDLPFVQGLNAFLVVCFFLVYTRMDKKCTKSMLKDARRMDELNAKTRLAYIRKFQGKKAFFHHFPYALLMLVLVFLLCGMAGSLGMLPAGIVMVLLTLFASHIRYYYTMYLIRWEIKGVFPGWLFDVLLLTQSENVAVALAKSIERAPAVLKEDLKKMKRELEQSPLSADAFLGFLSEYRMPEVEGIMRKMYSLNCGVGACGEVMNQMIHMNMTMLADADAQRLKWKGDMFSLYYMLPTVPVMVCMAGYGAALMAVIFKNVLTVI